jgi:hypothetical protein
MKIRSFYSLQGSREMIVPRYEPNVERTTIVVTIVDRKRSGINSHKSVYSSRRGARLVTCRSKNGMYQLLGGNRVCLFCTEELVERPREICHASINCDRSDRRHGEQFSKQRNSFPEGSSGPR